MYVLLTPLVKFIRNCIRDPSGVFAISPLAKISMTSFSAFSRLSVFGWLFVYIITRTLQCRPSVERFIIFYKTKLFSFHQRITLSLEIPLKAALEPIPSSSREKAPSSLGVGLCMAMYGCVWLCRAI